jgi:hypothetical protein
VCGTTVFGNMTLYNNGAAVQIGSADPLLCVGDKIGGNLVANNTDSVLIFDNAVGGNATVNNNTARPMSSATAYVAIWYARTTRC